MCVLAERAQSRCTLGTLTTSVMLQGEGEEEETDDLVSQVLDEIGVTLNSDMVGVPGKEAQAAKQACPGPYLMYFLHQAKALQLCSRGSWHISHRPP